MGNESKGNLSLQNATIDTICSFVPFLKNQYNDFINSIIRNMKSNTKPENLRPYISCLGSVSRIDGSKLSDYIPQFIDKLFEYCGKVDDKEKEDEIVYFIILIVSRN